MWPLELILAGFLVFWLVLAIPSPECLERCTSNLCLCPDNEPEEMADAEFYMSDNTVTEIPLSEILIPCNHHAGRYEDVFDPWLHPPSRHGDVDLAELNPEWLNWRDTWLNAPSMPDIASDAFPVWRDNWLRANPGLTVDPPGAPSMAEFHADLPPNAPGLLTFGQARHYFLWVEEDEETQARDLFNRRAAQLRSVVFTEKTVALALHYTECKKIFTPTLKVERIQGRLAKEESELARMIVQRNVAMEDVEAAMARLLTLIDMEEGDMVFRETLRGYYMHYQWLVDSGEFLPSENEHHRAIRVAELRRAYDEAALMATTEADALLKVYGALQWQQKLPWKDVITMVRLSKTINDVADASAAVMALPQFKRLSGSDAAKLDRFFGLSTVYVRR